MAIKKDIFNKYVQDRESNDLSDALKRKRNFTHNKVFQLSHDEDSDNDPSNASQTLVKDPSNASQTLVNTSMDNLSGLQLELIKFMLKNLEDKSLKITIKITTSMLINALNSSKSMVEQGVYRLKKKGCIELHKRKNGRGGWCQYKLPRSFILENNTSQVVTKDQIDPSIYNSNITNTIKNKVREIDAAKNHSIEQKDQLIAEMQKQIAELQKSHHQDDSTSSAIEKTEVDNDDLYEIDISPLEPFGFTQKHLKQVIAFNSKLDDRSKINAEDLEESIQHYAWALENRFEEMTEKYGKSFANNKLKILMGVLKKGQSWTEPQFRSAEEIALEEQVKANKEKLKKLQTLQEEAFNSAYELWKLELTKEQYTKIKDSLPSSYANLSDGSKMLVTALKNHFRENVYKG